MTFEPDAALVHEHLEWLAKFDPRYSKRWSDQFAADAESAMCEAAVRRLLDQQHVVVSPNESLTGHVRAPDFQCSVRDATFLVEVTCISIEKVASQTGLPHLPQDGARNYRPLTDACFEAVRAKARQCASQPHATLLAIGTFHSTASSVCIRQAHAKELLTGEQQFAVMLNKRTGRTVGDPYGVTHLTSAPFLRPDEQNDWSHARCSVSGLLVFGLGKTPPAVLGVLHPKPARPFDRSLLPQIPFARLRDEYRDGVLSVEWI